MDGDIRGGREELRRVEEGETVVRSYSTQKESINKWRKRSNKN